MKVLAFSTICTKAIGKSSKSVCERLLIAALTARPPDPNNGIKPIGSQHSLVSTSGASADGVTVANGCATLIASPKTSSSA